MANECLSCQKRGDCCKNFKLGTKGKVISLSAGYTRNNVETFLKEEGLPFVVLGMDKYEDWRFGCFQLDKDTGLCLNYENRPYICRNYVPGNKFTSCYQNSSNNKYRLFALVCVVILFFYEILF